MTFQLLEILKRPVVALAALGVATILGFIYLYFDELLFVYPYFTFYVPLDSIGIFILDIALSAISGFVMAVSAYQLKNLPKNGNGVRTGIAGSFLALLAGACPCYYLIPLLAVAGGAGGVLGVIGIAINLYELPIKLASLVLLGFVTLSLERSLRAFCEIKNRAGRVYATPSSILA